MSAATDAFVQQNQPRLLEELKQFLRIPSISTLPENRPDIERAANFVADALRWADHPYFIGQWSGSAIRARSLTSVYKVCIIELPG